MSLFLCVDCGGSKTSVAITNRNGDVVGRALGGPSNFSYVSVADFQDTVGAAISSALKTCLSPPTSHPVPLPTTPDLFAAAWFGISGVDSPAAIHKASCALAPLLNIPLGPRLAVANDTHLLAAPLRLRHEVAHAVTAIAGTGSCVVSFAKDSDGALVELGRTGGLGWILGDEGGGFHVGRETIRLMMHDHARASLGMAPCPDSSLKEKVLARFHISGQENAAEMLSAIHIPESRIQSDDTSMPAYQHVAREKRLSQLCPLVFDAAFKDGDQFALRVLRSCAGALAEQISMVCIATGEDGSLKPKGVRPEEAILCFGGSLVGVEAYRELVLDELKKLGCVFRYVEFVDDAAAVGAIGLAASGLGRMENTDSNTRTN